MIEERENDATAAREMKYVTANEFNMNKATESIAAWYEIIMQMIIQMMEIIMQLMMKKVNKWKTRSNDHFSVSTR